MANGLLSKGITLSIDGSVIPGLQSIPSLGGTPDKVDITTLADAARHYMNGIKDYGDLAFKFLYIPADSTASVACNYTTVKAFDDDEEHACVVTLADNTAFEFDATIVPSLDEAEVNQALTFTVNCGLTSDITSD